MHANAGALAVAAGIFAAGAIPLTVVFQGYLRGLAHGVVFASFVFAVLTSFHAVSGAHASLAGAWGEDNTRDRLKVAKRKRLIWGWVDNLEINSGDVDHLVITRSGAVLALDSKWHYATDPASCTRDTEAARRGARNARLILHSLGHRVSVTPVVVMWGGAQSDLPFAHQVVDGVDVVKGSELVPFLRQFASPVGDQRRMTALREELIAFRKRVQPQRRFA